MPFAFWKTAKVDETKESLLSGEEPTGRLDLDPGSQASGAFTFGDMEVLGRLPRLSSLGNFADNGVSSTISTPGDDEDAPLLQDEQIETLCGMDVCNGEGESAPLCIDLETTEQPVSAPLAAERAPVADAIIPQSSPNLIEKSESTSHDRDSGVFLIDASERTTPSRPTSVASTQGGLPQFRPSSFSLRRDPSLDLSSSQQRTNSTIKRLHRPTELNLSNTATNGAKPQTELEKRFDVMRNSKSQSKAALRSPTQLMQERLNMAPRKSTYALDETIRVFVPPQPSRDGCLLPGPANGSVAFSSTSVRARTGIGRPAWWCKSDKLVVFDGIDDSGDGELKFNTRTSKGLSIARRRGDTETIVIPMDCAHCQEMLHRSEWKYDIQVCKRSVCWDCKERCKWEKQQEQLAKRDTASAEVNRYRADSVLQDDDE